MILNPSIGRAFSGGVCGPIEFDNFRVIVFVYSYIPQPQLTIITYTVHIVNCQDGPFFFLFLPLLFFFFSRKDLPNNMIHQVEIFSLPQDWLWCETWCSDESKKTAKTIDMVCDVIYSNLFDIFYSIQNVSTLF